MKDSLRWLRLYLGLAGALVFLNVAVVAQIKGLEHPTWYALPLSFAFATGSVFCGLLMFFAAWRCEHLVLRNPGFIRGALLLRWILTLVERLPFAVAGDLLSIALLILWTGMTFFMIRMTTRLTSEASASQPREVA